MTNPSRTYSFFSTKADIVLSAYERIQVRAPELRQEHMLSVYKEFNFLLSEMSNRQVNLWEVERIQTVLTPGVASLTLTPQTIIVLDASIGIAAFTSRRSRAPKGNMSNRHHGG
jgi:hypothetical protein